MDDRLLDNENIWKMFCYFFRNRKLYHDWTDDEIEMSRCEGDFEEFVTWLVDELEAKTKNDDENN